MTIPQQSSTPASARGGGRDNNFNLLRFVLASLVLLAHSPELIDGDRHRELLTQAFGTLSFGELAVDGFFLLSGYLIVQSWQHAPDPKSFLIKRLLRIYPGFAVASLVSAFVVGPLGSPVAAYSSQLKIPRLLAGIVLLRLPAVPPVFAGQPYPFVNGPMWTIKFEFLSYILVAIAGLCGIFRHRALWPTLAAILLALSFTPRLANLLGYVPGLTTLWDDPLTMLHLVAFFCVGGCFYLFREHIYYFWSSVMLSHTWLRTRSQGLHPTTQPSPKGRTVPKAALLSLDTQPVSLHS